MDQTNHQDHFLKIPQAADILAKKFKQYDGRYYDLQAYCIMSNHFHLLIDTSLQIKKLPNDDEPTNENYTPLSKIMQLIKGGSAFEINKLLGRKGALWQEESYDRLVRNEEEHYNIQAYILNNPVKANLVLKWQDYPYSYYKYNEL